MRRHFLASLAMITTKSAINSGRPGIKKLATYFPSEPQRAEGRVEAGHVVQKLNALGIMTGDTYVIRHFDGSYDTFLSAPKLCFHFLRVRPHAVVLSSRPWSSVSTLYFVIHLCWILGWFYGELYEWHGDSNLKLQRFSWQERQYGGMPIIFAQLIAVSLLFVAALEFPWAAFLVSVVLFSNELLLRVFQASLEHRQKNDYKTHARNMWLDTIRRTVRRTVPRQIFDQDTGWCNSDLVRQGEETIVVPGLGCVHTWRWKHDELGRRISSISPPLPSRQQEIAVLGCSLTYGVGVDDNETYVARLEQLHPELRFANWATPGYSLVQMLLQLNALLSRTHLDAVILGFHQDLELRTTNSMKWLARIGNQKNPSCILRGDKLHITPPTGYIRLPFAQQVRLLDNLEFSINWARSYGRSSPELVAKTTEAVLLQIQALCVANQTKLLVACLHESTKYYGFFQRHAFNWCIAGLDLSETDAPPVKHQLFPYDSHPNAMAHKRYAELISDLLSDFIQGKPIRPRESVYREGNESSRGDLNIYPLF
jgi:hypothetical protein